MWFQFLSAHLYQVLGWIGNSTVFLLHQTAKRLLHNLWEPAGIFDWLWGAFTLFHIDTNELINVLALQNQNLKISIHTN